MNKNLKLALIMVIVFSPIILFLLPIGIFTLLAIPLILLVAAAILLLTEAVFRILKNRGTSREETEDLHMKRKLVWFWVNTATAVSAMYFDLDLLAWSSFFTIPYLSRNVYQCWHDFRMKEAGFRELWKEYRKAYNVNTSYFAAAMFLKLYLGAGFLVKELNNPANSLIHEFVSDPGKSIFILGVIPIGLVAMRSWYKDVKDFSVEVIPGDEDEEAAPSES